MHGIYNTLIIDKNSGILHVALLLVMHCRRCRSSHLLVGAPVIAYLEMHGSIPVVISHPYGAITLVCTAEVVGAALMETSYLLVVQPVGYSLLRCAVALY